MPLSWIHATASTRSTGTPKPPPHGRGAPPVAQAPSHRIAGVHPSAPPVSLAELCPRGPNRPSPLPQLLPPRRRPSCTLAKPPCEQLVGPWAAPSFLQVPNPRRSICSFLVTAWACRGVGYRADRRNQDSGGGLQIAVRGCEFADFWCAEGHRTGLSSLKLSTSEGLTP